MAFGRRKSASLLVQSEHIRIPDGITSVQAVLQGILGGSSLSPQNVQVPYVNGSAISVNVGTSLVVLLPVFYLSTTTTAPPIIWGSGITQVTAPTVGETTTSSYPCFALGAVTQSGAYSLTLGSGLLDDYAIVAPVTLGMPSTSMLGSPTVVTGTSNTAATVNQSLSAGQQLVIMATINTDALGAVGSISVDSPLVVVTQQQWNYGKGMAAVIAIAQSASAVTSWTLSVSNSGTNDDLWGVVIYSVNNVLATSPAISVVAGESAGAAITSG